MVQLKKKPIKKVKVTKIGKVVIPGTPFHMYKQERMAANSRLQNRDILADWQKLNEKQVNKYKLKLEAMTAAAVDKESKTVKKVKKGEMKADESENEDMDADDGQEVVAEPSV